MLVALAQGKALAEIGELFQVRKTFVRELFKDLLYDLGEVVETKEQIQKGKVSIINRMNAVAGAKVVGPGQGGNPSIPSKYELESNPEMLNKPFRDLLTDGKEELNQHEIKFCWSYVASNDWGEALKASNLDIGLYTATKTKNGRVTFRRLECYTAVADLRVAAMKCRPEIHRMVQEVREQAIFNVDIDKDFLQRVIMIEIDRLRDGNGLEEKKLLHRYLEMLGRSFGAFSEKLTVETIDHAAVMRAIVDKAGKTETMTEAIERMEKEEQAEVVN